MLERVVPTYRLTDYQDNGDLLADTVNKDFDRLWMAIQRSFIYLGLALRRPLLGGPFNAEGYRISNGADPVDKQDFVTRNYAETVYLIKTLRVPEADVAQVPSADLRANKLLAFNSAGQPIAVLPGTGSASEVMIELAKPTGTSLIGDESGLTLQERLHYDASDIALYGYVYGSGADAKQPILDAIARTGKAHVSGDITVSSFDWPQGARLTGKSKVNYLRRPGIACNLDSEVKMNKSKQKGTYVFGDYDIWDMLQLKTAGFNIIMHYGYTFHDGGTFEKMCNSAEAVGIDIIINSPNDTPPQSVIDLDSRDCVKGYYLFDEPQHQGISIADQNSRIAAWRSVTNKQLMISDNGMFGFDSNTIASTYDVILVDQYYIAAETDSNNKMFAINGWEELKYKSKNAKLMPAVGLFTGDAATSKEKSISFARSFFAMGDGSYFCFAWDASTSDPSLTDIITDPDFYNTAVVFNGNYTQNAYKNEVYLFGPSFGLNDLLRIYNQRYSSTDVIPFAVINTGSATDERHQAFSDTGLAFKNSGGNICMTVKNEGCIVLSIVYRNHTDGVSPTKFTLFTSPDDYFSSSDIVSYTLNPSTGKSSCIEISKTQSIGIRIEPSLSSSLPHKFMIGHLITSTWNGNTF